MTGIIAMRAQVSAIGTLKVSGGLFGGLAMQLRVNPLRELTRNAFDGCDVVDRSGGQATHSAEARQQSLPALWPMPSMVSSCEFLPRLRTTRPHAGDRKPVRLVPDLCDQHQRLGFTTEHKRRTIVGKHEFLEADLAILAFRDADQHARVQPEFLEHLPGDHDLPLAAVDQHQLRKNAFATCHGRKAPRQHLAHGRVVIPRLDPLDVVATIFRERI